MTTHMKKAWKRVNEMNIRHNLILGPINAESLLKDPKHIAFTLSRYKFAAKMMQKCKHIIEIGCGEGIGTLILLRDTSAVVTAMDFDESQIEYANEHILPHAQNRLSFICQDLISTPHGGNLGDGLVSLDVIEHVDSSEEEHFLRNCVACLEPRGIAVFGTPNKFTAQYSSVRSRQGHINPFDPERIVSTLERYFNHVFLFSMNDEMVHTGHSGLAHYLITLCVK